MKVYAKYEAVEPRTVISLYLTFRVVVKKTANKVDLFGDDEDADDDGDSLFAAKPSKEQEPKPQPSKKKVFQFIIVVSITTRLKTMS